MFPKTFQPRITSHKFSQNKNTISKSAIQNYKQNQTNLPKHHRKKSTGSKNSNCCIPKKGEQNSSRPEMRHHARKRSEVLSTKCSSIILEDKTININVEEKKNNSLRKNKMLLNNNNNSCNSSNNNNVMMNYKLEIENLNKTIQMLLHYIKTITTHVTQVVHKELNKKNNIIKELEFKNEFLIKENTELKKKINMFYLIAKQFDLNEITYRNQIHKCLYDLYNENIYLRKSNLSTASISMKLVKKFNKSVQDKLQERKSSMTVEQSEQNNNRNSMHTNNENNPFAFLNNDNTNEHNDNPFKRSNSCDEHVPRTRHKRQRTYVNLNNYNATDIKGYNTIIKYSGNNDDNMDAFGKTMNAIGFMDKTFKRNDGSRRNVLEGLRSDYNIINNKKEGNRGYTPPNHSKFGLSNKKIQLFYRTPGRTDKKKIEFINTK